MGETIIVETEIVNSGRKEMRSAIVLGVVLVIACAFAAPAKAATCGADQCSGQINTLYVNATGNIYVAMVGGLSGLTGCTPNVGAQAYVTLIPSSSNFNQVYATLLSAEIAARSISLVFLAGSNGCTILYVTT
jgi:hypothetical protein